MKKQADQGLIRHNEKSLDPSILQEIINQYVNNEMTLRKEIEVLTAERDGYLNRLNEIYRNDPNV